MPGAVFARKDAGTGHCRGQGTRRGRDRRGSVRTDGLRRRGRARSGAMRARAGRACGAAQGTQRENLDAIQCAYADRALNVAAKARAAQKRWQKQDAAQPAAIAVSDHGTRIPLRAMRRGAGARQSQRVVIIEAVVSMCERDEIPPDLPAVVDGLGRHSATSFAIAHLSSP